jgi:hypothetical protein
VLARIWHLATEALAIFTLTCAAAAAAILVTWATARIIGSRRAHRQPLPYRAEPVAPAARSCPVEADAGPGCLACGGTGTVLRAVTASHYQAGPCPACDPAERAG